jgi:hypothetical protein
MRIGLVPVLVLAGGLSFIWPGTARAEKLEMKITPRNAAEAGFVVTFRRGREPDTVTVRVARDTAKSQPVRSPDLMLRRSATLRVHGDAGLLLECQVEPRDEHGALVYDFTLARPLLAHAALSVAEIDDYKTPGREHLLGGGTFYDLSLAEFPGKP